MAFVKLDTNILDSTLWYAKDQRDVFLTALLLAQPREFDSPQRQIEIDSMEETGFEVPAGWYGFVPAAFVGIIDKSKVPLKRGVAALKEMGLPEIGSRSTEYEGRRLIRINGGFLVLNYMKYRDRDHTAAERMQRLRARQRGNVTPSHGDGYDPSVTLRRNVTHSREQIAEAEAEAEKEQKQKTCSTALSVLPSKPVSQRVASQEELIYQAYPRHVGKRDALAAINKAVKRMEKGENGAPLSQAKALGELWKAAAKYAQSPSGQQGELTPHPATWFNKSRYLDDPKEWSTGGSSDAKRNPRSSAAVVEQSRDALQEFIRRERASAGEHSGSSNPPSRELQQGALTRVTGDLLGLSGDIEPRATHAGLFPR